MFPPLSFSEQLFPTNVNVSVTHVPFLLFLLVVNVYRVNQYRSYFKRKWGLAQLEKLNSMSSCLYLTLVNMEKVNELLNEAVESVDVFKQFKIDI